jgi:hypothetical protein
MRCTIFCLLAHVHQVHFRSQHAPTPELQQEAARFFGAGPAPIPHVSQVPMSMPAQPFDVAGLRGALPATASVQRAQTGGVAGAAWAADFLARQPATPQAHTPTQGHAQGQVQGHAQAQVISATRVEQQDRVQSASVYLCVPAVCFL